MSTCLLAELLGHSAQLLEFDQIRTSLISHTVNLLAHSTLMGHATPTGPRPVPWNQVKSGTEMCV